jgi:hypothetical protein
LKTCIVESKDLRQSQRLDYVSRSKQLKSTIAVGIGIAIAVGFDIDPDSDCVTDPDTECACLLIDDKNLTLQAKHMRDHSL